jgi:hypothetical protein
MRINSPKQTQASRENGAKSKGVKSPWGKNRVRLNALKDGLFSKDIVIKSAGERKEDFERLKKEMWDLFQPASALEEMLVADIVENWWRRQRVRRAESADLKNRLDTSWIRDKLRSSDEVESLKATFFDLLRSYVMALRSQPSQYPSAITAKLEGVRQQLAGTSLGVEFLISLMKGVDSEAQEKGQVSLESEAMISACCGFGNEIGRMCLQVNSINIRELRKTSGSPPYNGDSDWDEVRRVAQQLKSIVAQNRRKATTETKKSQSDENEGSSAEQSAQVKKTESNGTEEEGFKFDKNMGAQMLSGVIKEAQLKFRKQSLTFAEKFETETRRAASIFPAEASDRFLRAETTIERRMYRALVMLLALRSESDVSKMLASKSAK